MANILNIKNEQGEWISVPAITGESAYDVAVRNGFQGTEQEWLASLKGEQGIQGPPGSGSETAEKLLNPRELKTNLESTTSASFDGTANASIGVTGILPIANGGTNSSTASGAIGNLVNGTAAETTIADDDYIPFRDTSASTGKKITLSSLKSAIGLTGSGGGVSSDAETAKRLYTARTFQTNLSSTSSASFDGTENVTPGITGTLSIANGGTGQTTAPKALYALGNGSSTDTSIADADYILFIDASLSTGKKITFSNLKSAIGSNGSSGGTVTGDYLPLSGGTLTGDLRIKSSSNYGTKINLGDGDYVYISEPEDDCLEIKGSTKINLVTSSLLLNGSAFPTGGGSSGGTASSADKLTTARTIRTNLGSTSTASFDGTANVTPGVMGTLSISNGGTGSTSAPTALFSFINGSSTENTIASTDYIPFLDTSASTGKKITFADLKSAIGSTGSGSTVTYPISLTNGGTGGTTAKAGLYNLINGSDTLTTLDTNDYIPIGDTSAGSAAKITMANLKTALGIASGGSTGSSETPFKVGYYTGNQSQNGTTSQSINIGYRPQFVFVWAIGASSKVLNAFQMYHYPSDKEMEIYIRFGAASDTYADSGANTVLNTYGSGFQVANSTPVEQQSSSGTDTKIISRKELNKTGVIYVYVAIGKV